MAHHFKHSFFARMLILYNSINKNTYKNNKNTVDIISKITYNIIKLREMKFFYIGNM